MEYFVQDICFCVVETMEFDHDEGHITSHIVEFSLYQILNWTYRVIQSSLATSSHERKLVFLSVRQIEWKPLDQLITIHLFERNSSVLNPPNPSRNEDRRSSWSTFCARSGEKSRNREKEMRTCEEQLTFSMRWMKIHQNYIYTKKISSVFFTTLVSRIFSMALRNTRAHWVVLLILKSKNVSLLFLVSAQVQQWFRYLFLLLFWFNIYPYVVNELLAILKEFKDVEQFDKPFAKQIWSCLIGDSGKWSNYNNNNMTEALVLDVVWTARLDH